MDRRPMPAPPIQNTQQPEGRCRTRNTQIPPEGRWRFRMMRFRGAASNFAHTLSSRPRAGSATRMVRLERESLNSLFETLEDWERHLAQLGPEGLRCADDQPAP